MMHRNKTIIHIIYNLALGGAEAMLSTVLRELMEYDNIVVTLSPENHFGTKFKCKELICISAPGLSSLPLAVLRIRRLIKKYNPVLVHSHLPLPNFAARIAVQKNIPLVTTIHTSIANAADYKKIHIRLLDQITYSLRKSKIIAVSHVALNDYFSVLNLKKHNPSVLYTFVDNKKFTPKTKLQRDGSLRLVSIGSFKAGKNIPYLIEVFKKLSKENITLDIYGRGHHEIEELIKDAGVPIYLRGQVNNLQDVLPNYDALIMPSQFEGFSLSVLEAMAVKLPLLLSDIASFKEQAKDTALYFDLNDVDHGYNIIMLFQQHPEEAFYRAEKAFNLMKKNYTLQDHMRGLRQIYQEVLR
jgi:glycosyltransferase involved in cell wall biosynthesis